jgi:hypothetical protein
VYSDSGHGDGFVAPLQGAGFGGGLLPRVALGSYGASLTLGYIRLPLWGNMRQILKKKLKFQPKNTFFQENFAFEGT